MNKKDLVSYLDLFLDIGGIIDSSQNWLQVDNSKNEIKKIWYAVDANTYIFDKAIEEKVDMIICHHWMFWNKPVNFVGLYYDRMRKLILNDIALYWAHLPLDAHEEVGNNAWLLNVFVDYFWLKEEEYDVEKFWEYEGREIWFWIKFKRWVNINELKNYCNHIKIEDKIFNFWNKDIINSIAFVSWWGWFCLFEANKKWYDLIITWEASHWEIASAKELGQSILLGGHYETEVFWPMLLANHLKEKFDLEIVFLDEKY